MSDKQNMIEPHAIHKALRRGQNHPEMRNIFPIQIQKHPEEDYSIQTVPKEPNVQALAK